MSHAPSWHSVSIGIVERELETSYEHGLGARDAQSRLAAYGPNEIAASRGPSPLAILAGQFQDFMVLVLLGATAVSAYLGEYHDVVAILAIVVMNAILGFVQELRAERSLAALRRLSAPHAMVMRDGSKVQIDAAGLVPGDIILLNQGDRVPADARVVECHGIEADESVLTGESRPVRKVSDSILRESAPVSERTNMLHAGAIITRGRGSAVVVATGMSTQMGEIAGMMAETGEGETPLQWRLGQLGKWIVAACLLICAAVAGMGVARGENAHAMFLAGVSLAVAAIPEGLPAIVTVSLALGVQRMSERKAIVRRLSAVEALGCATVICADKTGTLTQNEMTVVAVDLIGRDIVVTGSGYAPEGEFKERGVAISPDTDPVLRQLLTCAAVCNDASLTWSREDLEGGRTRGRWEVVGDPTEGALVALARKAGKEFSRAVKRFWRIAEIPFEAERRMMAVACEGPEGVFTFVKGAPRTVLELCSTRYQADGTPVPKDRNYDNLVEARNASLASGANRVLAFAYAPGNLIFEPRGAALGAGKHAATEAAGEGPGVAPRLTFLGLVAMMDPPRPEATRSIALAKQAGIRTVMITGDHVATAQAIAGQMGLTHEGGRVIDGETLERMSDERLAEVVDDVTVFARVAPAHKLRIVRALKRRGHIVAMTGDGVNDAPAIREADIGIAMGMTGTDVAREASSMVLSDDNYSTIIAAVEEGRSIYDNIRKFIRYLLASNVGEVLTMFMASAAGLPLPLTPIQLLWMNLMTDGLPAMALAADPTSPDAMNRPPRRPDEGVFAHGLGLRIVAQGVAIAVCTMMSYILAGVLLGHDLATARTMAFCTLVMSQLIFVSHCRSERHHASEAPARPNKFLIWAVAASVVLQACGVHLRTGREFLGTRSLSIVDWGVVLILSGGASILAAIVRRAKRSLNRRYVGFRIRSEASEG